MIKQFEKLTKAETELLLKAPVLVSVLIASGDHEISKGEKADAIKLAHLKTYTADPLLLPYYREVEKNFNINFKVIEEKYTPFDNVKREALKKEINILNAVIAKLDKEFARTLHRSLSGYAEHVKKVDKRFLETFVFPIPIHGLTD
jgi:hypothetical protein